MRVGRRALWWSGCAQDEGAQSDGRPDELTGGQGLVEERPSRQGCHEWTEETQYRAG